MNYTERFKRLSHVIMKLKPYYTDKFKIQLQDTIHEKNAFKYGQGLLSIKKKYETDGLIFYPNTPYIIGVNPEITLPLLKWKPFIQNTIDFSEVRSSQFVSALLMIAPKIKGDFSIKVNTEMNSYSYVMLTINAMRRLGFRIHMNEGLISISKEKKFDSEYFLVEPDWTSFYYWYAMAHLADEADLFFPGLHQNNMSKEKNCLFYIGNTALKFTDTIEGMRMQKIRKQGVTEFKSKYYFKQYPDIATTFALLLPALGCKQTSFVGLESLKFKECDREKAIGEQLAKMNVNFTKESNGWELASTDFRLEENTCFNTYGDHRMAMSAAPLALVKPITIEDETVVTKSYPHFWADLKSVGFKIQNL